MLLTPDELGAGLVPGHHEVHHPGQGRPGRDILSRPCSSTTIELELLAHGMATITLSQPQFNYKLTSIQTSQALHSSK